MDYSEAVNYITSLDRMGSRPGLERIRRLLDFLGNPEKNMKFVHIAGTNGKGSTTAYTGSILKESGYKTGVFFSPAIRSYCEYFVVDGEPMPEGRFAEYVELFKNEEKYFTKFELTLAIALKYYSDENCDWCVLETGMGGLLDATNIIPTPETVILTPVALDHMEFLGDTVEAITYQKCGIIKDNCKVASNFQVPEATEYIKANHPQTAFIEEAEVQFMDLDKTEFRYKGEDYTISLKGKNQVENACTAITAMKNLNDSRVTTSSIKEGIRKAHIPYRFDMHLPNLILDGAHNPAGFACLVENLKLYFPDSKFDFIIGMLHDKDVENSVKQIAELANKVYIVEFDCQRALKAEVLADIMKKYVDNVEIGEFHRLFKNIKEKTVITGSFEHFKEDELK